MENISAEQPNVGDVSVADEKPLTEATIEESDKEVPAVEGDTAAVQCETNEEGAIVDGDTIEGVTVAAKSEFAYLQRNEFTSEIYKIEIRNLGFFGVGVGISFCLLAVSIIAAFFVL